jgi:penicillin-binding protein 1A
MQSRSKQLLFSNAPDFETSDETAYDFLHEVAPFGFEAGWPEPGVAAASDQAAHGHASQNGYASQTHSQKAVAILKTLLGRIRYWLSALAFLTPHVTKCGLSLLRAAKPAFAWLFALLSAALYSITLLLWPNWRRPSASELAALRRGRRRRALIELAFWLTLAVGMLAMVVVALVYYYSTILPDPRAAGLTHKPPNITIRSADGEFLAERGMRRGYVTLDQMPRDLINAVISTEDRRFSYHFGFDLIGLTRAAYTNWRAGGVIQGGSTLTQQLAKNLFLQPKRHWTRKFEELILSLWLEAKFSKDQIIELYLNRIYFGSGAYGIESAAYQYFNKTTHDLTLAECAMLTGLIKAPSSLSPTHNPDAAQDRAGVVLKNMLDSDMINDKEYRNALGHPAELQPKTQTPGFNYLVDWITELVPSLVGEAEGNFTVDTTIDFKLQQAADLRLHQMMSERGRDLEAGEAAVVVLSPDGAVKTLVGGLDYNANQFNRAVKGRRQPGSAFKPFLYLAALESGMTPSALVEDTPIQLGDWRPQNYGGAYRGMIPLRTALAVSSNTVAVRLINQVGPHAVIKAAQRLGIYSDLDRGPTLALGAAEVTPIELTAAYAAFANGGYAVLPFVIERVTDENHKTLYEQSHVQPDRVIAVEHVNEMNEMLHAVVSSSGTGHRAALPGHQAAGKTGTTQNFNDAWFVGYTSHLVASVWVGNDRRRQMRHVTGGTLPAEIWRDIMQRAHRGLKPKLLPGVPLPGSRNVAAHASQTGRHPRTAPTPQIAPLPQTAVSVETPNKETQEKGAVEESGKSVEQDQGESADIQPRNVETAPRRPSRRPLS